MSVVGEYSQEELVTAEVNEICIKLKPDIEKIVGTKFKNYIPLSFRHQIVAGTNYVVKVHISVDQCIHAMIFAALDGGKPTVLKGKVVPYTDHLEPF